MPIDIIGNPLEGLEKVLSLSHTLIMIPLVLFQIRS